MQEIPRNSVTWVRNVWQKIFELMLRTASGQASKSELLGLGDNEFVPWQIGIMS